VFSLKRLPLPQDRRLSLMKSLMDMRQHPGEGNRRYFWLGAGPESPPQSPPSSLEWAAGWSLMRPPRRPRWQGRAQLGPPLPLPTVYSTTSPALGLR
jgi:hypothetical protein